MILCPIINEQAQSLGSSEINRSLRSKIAVSMASCLVLNVDFSAVIISQGVNTIDILMHNNLDINTLSHI